MQGEAVVSEEQEAEGAAPSTVVTPGWLRLAEFSAALLLAAHCLAGPRRVDTDMLILAIACLLVFAFRKHLPAPPARGGGRRELIALAVFTLGAAGVAVGAGYAAGQGPTPTAFVRTISVYVPYAFVQEYLTQRYLVVRLNAWLGWSSSVRVAAVVGLLFALLHLPYPHLILPTALAGFVWSACYLGSGRLLPVVASHAVLGTSFILWMLDHDPFANSIFASFP